MEKIIFVLGAGHCNNEYVSWVLNHSPDTGPRQPYTYTEYHSIWGTHYRAQDEWMLEQYDGVEPERTDFVKSYSHSGLRNPKYPHFFKRDLFEQWLPRLIKLHNSPAMCLYFNILDVEETIDYIKSKDWGVDVKFVTSYWDFAHTPYRHYYIMMEFDPDSTDDVKPESIDLDFMCASMVDRHNNQSEIANYIEKLDLVAFQSSDPSTWFNKVGLTTPPNLDLALKHYEEINSTKQDILLKLNNLSWKEIEEGYNRSQEWCDWQMAISRNNVQYIKKLIKPRLVDKQ